MRISSQATDSNVYEPVGLPKDIGSEVKDSCADGKRGGGSSVVFVAHNRFAVLDKTAQVSPFLVYFNRHPQILSAVDYHGAGFVEHRHENCETTCHYK